MQTRTSRKEVVIQFPQKWLKLGSFYSSIKKHLFFYSRFDLLKWFSVSTSLWFQIEHSKRWVRIGPSQKTLHITILSVKLRLRPQKFEGISVLILTLLRTSKLVWFLQILCPSSQNYDVRRIYEHQNHRGQSFILSWFYMSIKWSIKICFHF